MGIDFLDCLYRNEKEFGVRLTGQRLPERVGVLPKGKGPFPQYTAGDLHRAIVRVLKENGLAVPEDSWPRVRSCVAAVAGVPPEDVLYDSRLLADLGFS